MAKTHQQQLAEIEAANSDTITAFLAEQPTDVDFFTLPAENQTQALVDYLSKIPPEKQAEFSTKALTAFPQVQERLVKEWGDARRQQVHKERQSALYEEAINPPPEPQGLLGKLGSLAANYIAEAGDMLVKPLIPAGDVASALQNFYGTAQQKLPAPSAAELDYWSKRDLAPVNTPLQYLKRMMPATTEMLTGESMEAPAAVEQLPHMAAIAGNIIDRFSPFRQSRKELSELFRKSYEAEEAFRREFPQYATTDLHPELPPLRSPLETLREQARPALTTLGNLPQTEENVQAMVSQDTSNLTSILSYLGPEVLVPSPPLATAYRMVPESATARLGKTLMKDPKVVRVLDDMAKFRTERLAEEALQAGRAEAAVARKALTTEEVVAEIVATGYKDDPITRDFLVTHYGRTPEDANAVVTYLQKRGLIDPTIKETNVIETELNGKPTLGMEYKIGDETFTDPLDGADVMPDQADAFTRPTQPARDVPQTAPSSISPETLEHPFMKELLDKDLKIGDVISWMYKKLRGTSPRRPIRGELPKQVLGILKALPAKVVTRFAGDLIANIHEITHYADRLIGKFYKKGLTAFDAELTALGIPTSPLGTVDRNYLIKEGFAQFGVWYVLNEEEAAHKAPLFYRYWKDEILGKNEDLLQAFEGAKYITHKLEQMDVFDFVRAHTRSYFDNPAYLKTLAEERQTKLKEIYSMSVDSGYINKFIDVRLEWRDGKLVEVPAKEEDSIYDAVAAYRGKHGEGKVLMEYGVRIHHYLNERFIVKPMSMFKRWISREGPEYTELYNKGYKQIWDDHVPKGRDAEAHEAMTIMTSVERIADHDEMLPMSWSEIKIEEMKIKAIEIATDPKWKWFRDFASERQKFIDAMFQAMIAEKMIDPAKYIQYMYKAKQLNSGLSADLLATLDLPQLESLIASGDLIKRYNYHAPLQRVMEDLADMRAAEAMSSAGTASQTKEYLRAAKGSMRELRPWAETDIRFITAFSTDRAYTRLMRHFERVASDPANAGIGQYIEKLPKERIVKHISVKAAKRHLKKDLDQKLHAKQLTPIEYATIERYLDSLSDTDTMKQYMQRIPKNKEQGIYTYWDKNGERQALRIHKDLARSIAGLTEPQLDIMDSVLEGMATAVRYGAVLWSPAFMARNIIGDALLGAVSSKYMPKYTALVTYPLAVVRGILDTLSIKFAGLKKGDWYIAAMSHGLGGSTMADVYQYTDEVANFTSSRWVQENQNASYARKVARAALNKLGSANRRMLSLQETVEINSRLPEFRAGVLSGAPANTATRAGREGVIDYQRQGSLVSPKKRTVPFFNASIQASDKLIRLHKDKDFLLRIGAMASISVGWYLANYEGWEDYSKHEPWEREQYLLSPLLPDGRWPVPRFFRPYHAAIVRALDIIKGHDPQGLDTVAKTYLRLQAQEMTPNVFTSVAAMSEVTSGDQGWSIYRGRPIVPQSLMDEPHAERYYPHTPYTWRLLGNLPGKEYDVSPIKLEYFANQITGGLLGGAVKGAEAIAGKMGVIPEKTYQETVGSIPFVSAFHSDPSQRQGFIDEFYQTKNNLKLQKNSDTERWTEEQQLKLDKLEETEQLVQVLKKQQKELAGFPPETRDAMYMQLSNMQHRAISEALGKKFPLPEPTALPSAMSPAARREITEILGSLKTLNSNQLENHLAAQRKRMGDDPERATKLSSKAQQRIKHESLLPELAWKAAQLPRMGDGEARSLFGKLADLSKKDLQRMVDKYNLPKETQTSILKILNTAQNLDEDKDIIVERLMQWNKRPNRLEDLQNEAKLDEKFLDSLVAP